MHFHFLHRNILLGTVFNHSTYCQKKLAMLKHRTMLFALMRKCQTLVQSASDTAERSPSPADGTGKGPNKRTAGEMEDG